MQFTKFSRTGLSVSRLCLGTGTFGKQTDEAESIRVFDRAADAGVNFIDTADAYPGGADLPEVGRAEKITGLWLKGKRNRFILGTKAGGPMGSSPWDDRPVLGVIDGTEPGAWRTPVPCRHSPVGSAMP